MGQFSGRIADRSAPLPEPLLKMTVSESCHLRKLAKESPTPTMKQADAWGFSVTPMLIHAGVFSSAY